MTTGQEPVGHSKTGILIGDPVRWRALHFIERSQQYPFSSTSMEIVLNYG